MSVRVKNITGKICGRLRALRFNAIVNGKTEWWCLCDKELGGCGKEVSVRADSLNGNTKSCGCQKIDSATKHGHSHSNPDKPPSPTYNSWQAMKERCTNPEHHNFSRYGANGITVCDRWLGEDGFTNFLSDMGERPEGKTLDRYPDKTGNYEPSNCRWATPKEQSWNRSNSRIITIGTESHCVGEWAELTGTPRTVIQGRLKLGWDEADAVLTPYSPREKPKQASTPQNSGQNPQPATLRTPE